MTTRRSFLRQTALAATGLILSPSLFAQGISGKKSKIIIIGAGLAGLAAAYKLRQKNIACTVLESQKRIGGRVFSHQIDPDLVIELGGEWIGYSHTRMMELCDELKLELFNNQLDTHLIYRNEYKPAGKWDFSEKWQATFKSLLDGYFRMDETEQHALDQYDWWRYLVNNGCDQRDLDLRELMDSTDFGESIRQVSAFSALAEYAESSRKSQKNDMDLKVRGGNERIAQKLADAIGRDRIKTGHTVTKIIQEKDKAQVHCDNGQVFEADKIICTLPTMALSRIDWQPGLPPEKIQAVNALQYARINKHAMLFRERFWKEEAFDLLTDQLPHYFYHATKSQRSAKGVLISYSIGDKAAVIANQSDPWMAGEVDKTLDPYFGGVKGLLEKQANYYWGNDINTRGAYALYGPGQWFGLQPVLKEHFLHTHFAGEHLADSQGFMEGAIVSGETAADQVV